MTDGKEEDARLQDLWRRRDDLNEREWEDLHQWVYRILTAYPFKELSGLNLSLDDCIHDFFTHKVLLPTFREGYVVDTPIHGGALRCYFQRFLLDLHRAAQRGGYVSIEDAEPQVAEVAFRQFLDAQEPEAAESLNAATLNRIAGAAREFLESQEPWVGLYLRHCLCANSPIPLMRFKDYLPSYHYKAQQLGLAPPANSDYRRTLLGRWLRSLNLPTLFDDRDVAQAALKILCQQALLWVKDDLPFTDATDSANLKRIEP
ncbi:hypothetical protein [Candidatus Contendibacter odensensis]|uniref:Uncharacterized protein n=1 Tax=Candidatus Contendobacter odensis Run_B_J11 TaxID=1400861 RepID=A0A7U7J3K0_9GAMM|nr:hypothetical protein [Candidatus Contendobacter odensis]CDH44669.1 hypothetical protein BN874_1800007 [Candidatus Contendobacter odensis Run_B_J11]